MSGLVVASPRAMMRRLKKTNMLLSLFTKIFVENAHGAPIAVSCIQTSGFIVIPPFLGGSFSRN